MPRDRYHPDTPEAWIERARSDLEIARSSIPEAYLEDLCYHAQQCAEKALKAVLLSCKGSFPYVHDLSELLGLLEKENMIVPESVLDAVTLTPYAVESRYPGFNEPISETEHAEAVDKAAAVLKWSKGQIKTQDI